LLTEKQTNKQKPAKT